MRGVKALLLLVVLVGSVRVAASFWSTGDLPDPADEAHSVVGAIEQTVVSAFSR